MKAAVYYKYGSPDVVSIREVETPKPKIGEVLVQIKAASVNAYDWHLLKADPFLTRFLGGLLKPKNNILGADIAGVVIAVGKDSEKFKIGDEVYGCLESCGKGGIAAGGFAEYVCAKESVLAKKATMLSFGEAAALPMAATTALQALRDDAKLRQGQSILINGASGGVGMFAVQIAKAMGAEVTAVCSTGSVEMVHSLGADEVIDYKKDDVIKNGKLFDTFIDVAASRSVKDYRKALKPNGICVVIGYSTFRHLLRHSIAGNRDGKKITLCKANNKINDPLIELNKLVETGKLRVVIDSRYSLDDVAKALHCADTGHPKGKIVIEM